MGGFFWEDFFGRNSTKSYLNMEGIDLFVKILVFVKILSQWRRKEGGQDFQSLEAREASSSHLKIVMTSFTGF